MIMTFDIKQQLHTVFTVGATGFPKETILILGSCRCVPYLNYLNRWNESNGRPFRIHFIDPFNYNWRVFDGGEERVNMEQAIDALENDPRMRQVLGDTTIFIHEHYQNYGMFNTSKTGAKNIYQFGLSPRLDISVPNFHDRMILWGDCFPGVTDPSAAQLILLPQIGALAVTKFCDICLLTSFPEMAKFFAENWRTKRLFWTANHVSGAFTWYIFMLMNEKFLHLDLSLDFIREASAEDLFRDPHTAVTQFDRDAYGLTYD